MAKFLVLARPRKPLPEKANVEGARAQWRQPRDAGKAEVYEIIEDNGASFAIFIDVDEAYFHCPRSMQFADLWNTDTIAANAELSLKSLQKD